MITPTDEHLLPSDNPGYILNYILKLYPPTTVEPIPVTAVPNYSIPMGRGTTLNATELSFSSQLAVVDTGLYKVCVSGINKVGEGPCSLFASELYLRLKAPKAPSKIRLSGGDD